MRSVVLADPDTMQAWLSPQLHLDDVPEVLTPIADDRITVQPARVLVNSVRNDGPELLERRLSGGRASSSGLQLLPVHICS